MLNDEDLLLDVVGHGTRPVGEFAPVSNQQTGNLQMLSECHVHISVQS